jgi:predicted TIM-barrel fold metal-dependent hydrolase
MIVDVHTHTPEYKDEIPAAEIRYDTTWRPDRPVKTPTNWHDYLEAIEPADKAIVFTLARESKTRDAETGNDDTAEFVRAYPDRLIGFLSVHPHDPHCLEEIERGVSDLGLRGIKLGPNYQNVDPLGEKAFRVFKRAEELGLPILFHAGTSPDREANLDYAHPRHFDQVAVAFPNLKIILAHMAHPWQTSVIAVIRKHPHVYADTSATFYRPWSFYNCMRLAEEWGVFHKMLFGSDFPVTTVQENIDALRNPNRAIEGSPLPRISETAMEEIIHRDSLSLLGLAQ